MKRSNLPSALLFAFLLSACGGGSDKEPTPPSPIVNKAPIVSMHSTLTIESGASTTLSSTISDPEGGGCHYRLASR